MNSLKLIEQLSNAYGACGFEDQVVEIAEKFAQDEALGSVRRLQPQRLHHTRKKCW